ncbi:hypothetical protein AVEN_171470-1 [Araneus ventricosus]|uniref:Uncharacterized protein n=1 Tax=Araneus ventricosus TaxID=182803 RepID=A0A4Y2KTA7_ARAVE|nr:hypothetical protein AVEN_171470-1 [Araneus ventricosus]
MYGESSSTSKIMENNASFSNIPENKKHRQQEKQSLHKLATRVESKSLISTNNSAQRLTANSQCEQDSKEILRASKTFAVVQQLREYIVFPTGCDVPENHLENSLYLCS